MIKIILMSALVVSALVPALASAEVEANRPPRRVVCDAHNRRGEHFEGVGFDRAEAERHALHECRAVSRECFVDRCRDEW